MPHPKRPRIPPGVSAKNPAAQALFPQDQIDGELIPPTGADYQVPPFLHGPHDSFIVMPPKDQAGFHQTQVTRKAVGRKL